MGEESLRDALEKAYDESDNTDSSEAGGSTEDSQEQVRDTAPTEQSEPSTEPEPTSGEEKERGSDGKFLKKKEEETPAPDKKPETEVKERPPESWKPAAREHWAKIPAEVRQEIQRREGEMYQFVQQSSGARKIADQFMEAVNPYMGMIQAEGGTPIQAVQNMLKTAAFLRTGPSSQKAMMIAKLVKDHGISIKDLDSALVGEQVPDSQDDKINKLLEQRLAPVNQLIERLNGIEQKRVSETDTEADKVIEAFANDPANEFFQDVFEDMAEIVEIAQKRGRAVTLKQAYDTAVKYSPTVQEALKTRVQSKRNASSSVPTRGPSMGTAKNNETSSLREDIEASWNSQGDKI